MNPFKFLTDLVGAGSRVKLAAEEAEKVLGEAEEQKRQMLLDAREESVKIRSTAGKRTA